MLFGIILFGLVIWAFSNPDNLLSFVVIGLILGLALAVL